MDYPTQKADGNAENASIKSYLDELCASLGEMPQEQRDEIRQEIGAHLQSLMAMKREPNRVLESALQQFGDPSEIGRLLALEWENREWDLSGLSLLERIQKIREAIAPPTVQVDWRKTMFTKRIRRQILLNVSPMLLLMVPLLLFMVKASSSPQNFGLVRVLDVAIVLSCGLNFVVSLTLAWGDWHKVQVQESKISRVQSALSHVAVGLFSLTLLTSFSHGILPAYVTYLMLAPAAIVALVAGLTAFEPSRKTKIVSTASMGWGIITGLFVIPGCFKLLSALGVSSIWVQLLIVGPVAFVLRTWFWKSQSMKRRQNVG